MVIAVGDSLPESLETRVVNFSVPAGWAKAEGPNPHDAFQKLLEQKGLWSGQFLYGSAPPDQLEELIKNGFAHDQLLGSGWLKLVGTEESRDHYCNRQFFMGRAVVAIYWEHMLSPAASPSPEVEGLGLRFKPPESRYALAAVALPKVDLTAGLTHPNS